jgi:hypothetical protein
MTLRPRTLRTWTLQAGGLRSGAVRSTPSRAVDELVAELHRRGLEVTPRKVENWQAIGLAPKPSWEHLGRAGSSSSFDASAVEHYAALASFMRRGIDRRIAGLRLLARGFVSPDENLFRRGFHELVDQPRLPEEDPLDYADRIVKESVATRRAAGVLATLRRNLRRAGLLGDVRDPANAVADVIWTLSAGAVDPDVPTDDALYRASAAFGVPVGEMSEEDVDRWSDLCRSFLGEAWSSGRLGQYIDGVPADEILVRLPPAREMFARFTEAGFGGLGRVSRDIPDVMTAFIALLETFVENGGFSFDGTVGELGEP